MYTQYFQLREMPFSITPDPAYLYLSPRHQEALGHLLYGTGQYGGFVQLTGEVGTGKTTIIRTLLMQKLPEVDVAMIHNPRQSEQEFVQSLCDELGIRYSGRGVSLKVLIDSLNEHLLRTHAAGRRTVLIIDEAQNLQPSVLEQVRLLTNLETHKEKLLRIMLVGQPELSGLLARPDLRQLAQRITARYHLMPLDAFETAEYVRHRLRVAGGRPDLFAPKTLELVHQHARGVPRLINILCDRALLGAYGTGVNTVTPEIVRRAAMETVGNSSQALAQPNLITRFWIGTEKVWAPLAAILALLLLYQNLRESSLFSKAAPAPVTMVRSTNPPAIAQQQPATQPPPAVAAKSAADNTQITQLLQSTQPLPVVMGRLINLWDGKLRLGSTENVCRALHKQKLECYRGQAKWNDLGQMNRPALLTLRMSSGEERYVLLRELSTTHATLDTAMGLQHIPLDVLDRLWTGEFLLVWRSESGESYIGPETHGQPILWLLGRLTQLGVLKPQRVISDRFDQNIRDALIKFQTARGLEADGVAGIRTLIALGEGQPHTPTLGGGT